MVPGPMGIDWKQLCLPVLWKGDDESLFYIGLNGRVLFRDTTFLFKKEKSGIRSGSPYKKGFGKQTGTGRHKSKSLNFNQVICCKAITYNPNLFLPACKQAGFFLKSTHEGLIFFHCLAIELSIVT